MRMTRRDFLGGTTAVLAAASSNSSLAAPASSSIRDTYWIGVELCRNGCPKYVGVMCVNHFGVVLNVRELTERDWALKCLAEHWGRDMRILATEDDLFRAVRDCHVFGAVVDVASPTAISLAEDLAARVKASNPELRVRVLDIVDRPHWLPPGPARRCGISASPHFDITISAETPEPWLEHRDIAELFALQYEGLVGVDFGDVLSALQGAPRIGYTGWGTAYCRDRARLATDNMLRALARRTPGEAYSSAILLITAEIDTVRLAEIRTAANSVRSAFPKLDTFVLGHSSRYHGSFFDVTMLAITDSARRR